MITLDKHVAEELRLDPGYCKCGLSLDHEDHIPAPEKPKDEALQAPEYRKRLLDFLTRNGTGTGDYRTLKKRTAGHVQYSLTQEGALDESAAKQRLIDLLWIHCDRNTCRGCNADIWWIKNNIGKPIPYDASGQIHFVTCSLRDRFKKGK
jgi:hypothetical protein